MCRKHKPNISEISRGDGLRPGNGRETSNTASGEYTCMCTSGYAIELPSRKSQIVGPNNLTNISWCINMRASIGPDPLDSPTPACPQHSIAQSIPFGSYTMLRNSASGPEIGLQGRMSAGFESGKHQNRPSGRPEGRFRGFPIRIRPKSRPEDRFSARRH